MTTRRLAAILAADVAGYSRLMHADEEGTHAGFVRIMAEAIEPAFAHHGGRIVKSTGDGFLAEFQSVVAAVRCAVEFQHGVAELTADDPAAQRIAFRVGIHIGDVIVEDDDIFGDGVNIAARLEALADPGGILVSATVHENVFGRLDCRFEDRGEQQLKNISRPVRAFRIIQGPAGPDRFDAEAPVIPEAPSVVVLPFRNVGDDPQQEYLADGIVEDVTLSLSQFRSLFVIARNSAFTYKARAVDVRQVGRELGVRYVLEGSVRCAANQIRITSQLIRADTGAHLWAQRYERELSDIFATQDEIAAAVAAAIEPAVEEAEHQRARLKPPESLGAWEAYHRGLWHHSKSSAPENELARTFFRRAVALDPTFSRAYQGLVYTHLDDAILYLTCTVADAAGLAEPLAHKAVVLDPGDAGAYLALAYVNFSQGDLEAALAAADQALVLNANFAGAYWAKSGCLVYLARYAEASQAAMTFLRLSPRDPRNWRVLNHLVIGRYLSGDYPGSIEAARRALRAHPDQPLTYRWLAAALGQLGRVEDAQAVIHEAAAVLAPVSFDSYACTRGRWLRPDAHALLMDGLRKAGWHAAG